MLATLIRASITQRFFVLLAALVLSVWGIWAMFNTPVDALPDLSDTQVIIRTPYPGKAPQLVENQITYPLTTAMLSVPGAKTVRGFSAFGDSFVYIIFKDGTDSYWARSRVLEYLNQAQGRLPAGVTPALGPDATGIGWIFEYALVDKTEQHDLADLRSLQDWLLKFELSALPGVAEVASVGGVVKQYQIVVDPVKLVHYKMTLADIRQAVANANQEAGGSVLEQAEAEYMIRATGYLQNLDDFKKILIRTNAAGTPIYLEEVATIRLGPDMRRGLVELDGKGEVAGGIVLMRSGENARAIIERVKARLSELKTSLPKGVEVVTTYDRGDLITRAVDHLKSNLLEEFVIVAIVCVIFLLHLRSAMVAILAIPLALFVSFIVMYYQGITANIMSLGGIAIAVGAMVDASVVMVENAHRRIEAWRRRFPDKKLDETTRWEVITEAAVELGPALFISLLIITFSFIPVFALEGQEGRLFVPLALTKLYAMGSAALVSLIVVPVLTGLWVRGKIPDEHKNPLNRVLVYLYHPLIKTTLRYPKATLAAALAILLLTLFPLSRLGGEFLPRMDEGDLLYMPSTLPGISVAEVGRLVQTTDKLIRTIPEVATVFGKAGRAETATDPAPMEMLETTVRLKPKSEWRQGMTIDKIIAELDATVRLPGVANLWIPPIRNRIDMISTGVKSPIGIKISGHNMVEIEAAAIAIQESAKKVPGVASALAERLIGGRYVDVVIARERAARYGMTIADVQLFVSSAVGGETIGETVEGIARYPINVRYPQQYRDSVASLQKLPIRTPAGQQISLGDVAHIQMTTGPTMLRSEQGRLSSWVYIDVRERDMVSVVHDLDNALRTELVLPAGVSFSFSGQYEMLERANKRLLLMIPATLLIIFFLLYLEFRSLRESLLIMLSLPFSLVGGIWFMYWQGYSLSVASGVGFIALAGLAAEFGVVMLIYLKHALLEHPRLCSPATASMAEIDQAMEEGAVLRVRPKAMTVATTVAGLLPIFWVSGTGSEIMTRIAAPMFGGMISAALLSMIILPVAYKLLMQGVLLKK